MLGPLESFFLFIIWQVIGYLSGSRDGGLPCEIRILHMEGSHRITDKTEEGN